MPGSVYCFMCIMKYKHHCSYFRLEENEAWEVTLLLAVVYCGELGAFHTCKLRKGPQDAVPELSICSCVSAYVIMLPSYSALSIVGTLPNLKPS